MRSLFGGSNSVGGSLVVGGQRLAGTERANADRSNVNTWEV
jgi:hypothetical protein